MARFDIKLTRVRRVEEIVLIAIEADTLEEALDLAADTDPPDTEWVVVRESTENWNCAEKGDE